ncbi:uncharacterized protein LOC134848498 [Symsagittifera roscoffensis]|uniref:uncharacterized protein LOC134848498 n=1 Tax=Symsagittifera roscoffensis TaxID=84072 RepID=UPI00307B19D3
MACYVWVIRRHNTTRSTTAVSSEMRRRTRKVNLFCFFSSLGFVLAWTPYTICGMLHLVTSVDPGRFWWLLSNMAAKTSALYNVAQFWTATYQLTLPTINPYRTPKTSGIFTVALPVDLDPLEMESMGTQARFPVEGQQVPVIPAIITGPSYILPQPRRDFTPQVGQSNSTPTNSPRKRKTSGWERRIQKQGGTSATRKRSLTPKQHDIPPNQFISGSNLAYYENE